MNLFLAGVLVGSAGSMAALFLALWFCAIAAFTPVSSMDDD